jgi:hypothetical protein
VCSHVFIDVIGGRNLVLSLVSSVCTWRVHALDGPFLPTKRG